MKHALATVALLITLCATAGKAKAQPHFDHLWSLESIVLNSNVIVVGKIESVGADGRITISVSETIKGPHRAQRQLRLREATSTITKWKKASASLLIALDSSDRDGKGKQSQTARVVDLGKPQLRADLSLLKNGNETVKAARHLVSQFPGVHHTRTFRIHVPRKVSSQVRPAPVIVYMQVPVDKGLEKYARKNATSSDYGRRREAAEALRYFRTDEHIALLKSLLQDKGWAYYARAEENRGLEIHVFGVRRAAFESLEYLGVEVPKPAFREELVHLERVRLAPLSNRKVALDDIRGLEQFTGLTNLFLWNSKVTPDAFKQVAKLKNLRSLYLAGSNVTDNDLKHLRSLEHLRYIDAAGTRITDKGLQALAAIATLKRIELKRASVSNAGVARLKKQRPDIEIVR